jgi:hypothetical protein
MTDIDHYKTYREVGTQLNSDILEAYSDRELIVKYLGGKPRGFRV